MYFVKIIDRNHYHHHHRNNDNEIKILNLKHNNICKHFWRTVRRYATYTQVGLLPGGVSVSTRQHLYLELWGRINLQGGGYSLQ